MHLSSPVQAGAEASGVPHRAAAPAYREGHDYAHAYGLRRRAVKASSGATKDRCSSSQQQ